MLPKNSLSSVFVLLLAESKKFLDLLHFSFMHVDLDGLRGFKRKKKLHAIS